MKTLLVKSIRSIGVLSALLWFPAAAQHCTMDTAHDSMTITKIVVPHFAFGGFSAHVDDFNSVMTANSYKRLKDYSYQFGFGFYSKYKNLIFNWELIGTHWPEGKHQTNAVLSVYGVNALFDVGFDVVKAEAITLYPYLGSGFGHVFMGLGKKSAQLNDVIAGTVIENRVWQRTMVLDAGVGFEFTQATKRGPGWKHVIGLRAGYWFDPTSSRDWYLDHTKIENGPKLTMSGPYARLTIGRSHTKYRHFQKYRKG
jgi:hypothetical protein